MIKIKLKSNFLFAITIALILMLLCSVATFFISPTNVFALTNTSSAVKAGDGAELYDKSTGTFNKAVMFDLVDKLFGTNDPIQYIKSNKESQTDSFVIQAPTINAKVGNGENGMVVKLGGKEWMAVSLTIADKDDKESAVLTLYLANSDGTSIYYGSNSNVKGNNAYSRSTLRNHLLTDENWSLFNQTQENSFASQFLVQPKYIKYQHNQTQIGRGTYSNHLANEALDEFKSGWSSNLSGSYKPSDTFNGIRYDAWGEDYIWVPSETHFYGGVFVTYLSCPEIGKSLYIKQFAIYENLILK